MGYFLIVTFQNIVQLLIMPAGLDIPICLALSPHPKIKKTKKKKSSQKRQKGGLGGNALFTYVLFVVGK